MIDNPREWGEQWLTHWNDHDLDGVVGDDTLVFRYRDMAGIEVDDVLIFEGTRVVRGSGNYPVA